MAGETQPYGLCQSRERREADNPTTSKRRPTIGMLSPPLKRQPD
ncbi:hypothetical protein SNOG_08303 [Parastagonospora nodorum SN15]|uniref:Uncharacterized protein n=1 Tax=Phaeosphaeria nodorum (strain SN15 / ATCC MYA-4574 / FGSC 10173) TaxID=321614 RepID=Q0UIW1_PHANO|nr:hypothetical protein SNOG_08303 [Parastagonospora nodorum SN15]EAT84579.1 hypothetical protein SNOG_08303 [Parastagonospora nodorum SN15]